MSLQFYAVISSIIAITAIALVIVGLVYFVMGIVGWRGPHRNVRLIRSLLLFSAYPLGFIVLQTLIHFAVLPTIARDRRQAQEQRLAGASLVDRGEQLPIFRIQDIDGNDFSTEQLHGKVVLLNFFATWCGPCITELPHLQEIWDSERHRNDFAMLVIGREETETAVREFKSSHNLSFPMAADADCQVYLQFAKKFIPRTYLIGKDGTICFASIGFSEKDFVDLKSAVRSQLNAH